MYNKVYVMSSRGCNKSILNKMIELLGTHKIVFPSPNDKILNEIMSINSKYASNSK